MRSKSFVRIFASAVFAMLFLSINSFDVNAQGRGKGGDRGDRGDRQQNRDGRNTANDRRGDRGRDEQVRSDRGSRKQQEYSDQNSRRQQEYSDRNSRQQQNRSDQNSRRQQEYSDRNSRQQQIRSDRESRRQQEYSDRNSRQQQNRSDRESRRQHEYSDQNSRRQQEWSDRNSRQQQNRSDRESRRQQEYSDQNSRRQQEYSDRNSRQRGSRNDRVGDRDSGLWAGYDYERSRRSRSDDRRKDRSDDRYDREYRSDRGRKNERARWNRGYAGTPVWANRNYDRPAWNRYARDQRKYQKEVYKDYRKQQRGRYYAGWNRYETYGQGWNGGYGLYGAPYYQTNVYGVRDRRFDDHYYDQNRSYQRYPSYRSSYYSPVYYQGIDLNYLNDDQYGDYGYADNGNWKDVLLRTVLSAFLGGQGSQYDRDAYYSREYQTISYLPYRNGGPQYYGQQPLYSTYTYGYPEYDDDSDAYGYDPYGRSYDDYSGIDPILMNISGSGSGTYLNELLGRAVASGYQQGLADGLYARKQGWNDQYYRDPYSYENNNYAYGSCSTSLAENRQLLSSGYELGYRDALNERDAGYYQEGSQGVDLVSLLLSNVLRVGA